MFKPALLALLALTAMGLRYPTNASVLFSADTETFVQLITSSGETLEDSCFDSVSGSAISTSCFSSAVDFEFGDEAIAWTTVSASGDQQSGSVRQEVFTFGFDSRGTVDLTLSLTGWYVLTGGTGTHLFDLGIFNINTFPDGSSASCELSVNGVSYGVKNTSGGEDRCAPDVGISLTYGTPFFLDYKLSAFSAGSFGNGALLTFDYDLTQATDRSSGDTVSLAFVPEPSTVTLMGLGLTFGGTIARRRKYRTMKLCRSSVRA